MKFLAVTYVTSSHYFSYSKQIYFVFLHGNIQEIINVAHCGCIFGICLGRSYRIKLVMQKTNPHQLTVLLGRSPSFFLSLPSLLQFTHRMLFRRQTLDEIWTLQIAHFIIPVAQISIKHTRLYYMQNFSLFLS